MKKYSRTSKCTVEVEFNSEEPESIYLINNYNMAAVETFNQVSENKVTFDQVRCDSPMTKSAILIYNNDPAEMDKNNAFLFFVYNLFL